MIKWTVKDCIECLQSKRSPFEKNKKVTNVLDGVKGAFNKFKVGNNGS